MEVPLRLLVDALVKVNIVGVGVGVSYGGTYYTLLRSSLGIEMMMMMMVTMTMVTMMMTMTMLIRMAIMMMLITLVFETFLKLGELQCKSYFNKN